MQYTNKEQIPLALCVLFLHSNYDYNRSEKTISATSLLDTTKQIILLQRLTGEGIEDVSDRIASSLGSAIHTALEQAWTSNPEKIFESLGYHKDVINNIRINPHWDIPEGTIPVYVEQRASKQIAGWTVTGKFDIIIDGRLNDLKNRQAYAYIFQSNAEKDILQASIYRWLNQDKVTQEDFSILWLFTDWSKKEARQNRDYPQKRWMEQKYSLKPVEVIEEYIVNKLNSIDKLLDRPESELPDCTKEDLWMDDPVWKYYKDPTKTARSTKNFTSQSEANMRLIKDGNVGLVVEYKAYAKRCGYCPCSTICEQYLDLKSKGLIQE
jgi:hypothetical protein